MPESVSKNEDMIGSDDTRHREIIHPDPVESPSERRTRRSSSIDRRIVDHSLKIQEEKWVKSYWRPAMAWLYMLICFTDFVLFPAMALIIPAVIAEAGATAEYTRWESLTLTNGGIMHVAFGAILGIAAWSRGKEKLNGIS